MSAKKYDFVPKTDVRQLIKVTKEQSKRINHPHARYNQLGRISCIVCGVQIKSEHAWNAHILSKSHKQNESREVQASAKRLTESTPAVLVSPIKKPKLDETNSKLLAPESHSSQSGELAATVVREQDLASLGEKNPAEKSRTDGTSGSKLPEGFFDDRYKDAKARNVPYKDKFTEEMEVFQKEMGSLEKESEIIMEKESEAMISSRELEEIDTQMQKWNRIKQLQTEVETFENKRRQKSVEISRTKSGSSEFPGDQVKKEELEHVEFDDGSPSSHSFSSIDDELYDFRTKKVV